MKKIKIILLISLALMDFMKAQHVVISDSLKITNLLPSAFENPVLAVKNDTVFKRSISDLKLISGFGVLSDTSVNNVLINEGFGEQLALKIKYYNSDPLVKGHWDQIDNYANNPFPRQGHVAVFTAGKFIVWGSLNGINSGGIYDVVNQTWQSTSTVNSPVGTASTPFYALAVGTKVIIWTVNASNSRILDVTTNQWSNISEVGAFASPNNYSVIACDNDLIFFSWDNNGSFGKKYNVVTNQWSPVSQTNIPIPRDFHSTIWTGTEMIIWGGSNLGIGPLNTGHKYNPQTDTWTSITVTNAPIERYHHAAVFTGSEMIIYGGRISPGTQSLTSGARYNIQNDTWLAISSINTPSPRPDPLVAWTGSKMIIWGSKTANTEQECQTGALYDVSSDSWAPISTFFSPPARKLSVGVWANDVFLIWGGLQIQDNLLLNDFFSLSPSTDGWSLNSEKFYYLYKKL